MCVRPFVFRLYSITLCLASRVQYSRWNAEKIHIVVNSRVFSSSLFCVIGSAKCQNSSQQQNQPIMFESLLRWAAIFVPLYLCAEFSFQSLQCHAKPCQMAKQKEKKYKMECKGFGVMHIQMETIRAVLYWSNFNSIETQYSLFYLRRAKRKHRKKEERKKTSDASMLKKSMHWNWIVK